MRVVKHESQLFDIPDDLSSEARVHAFLTRLLPAVGVRDPAAALVPWVCDRLLSMNSRKAYAADLAKFVTHLHAAGIDPLSVTGDHVRIYKEALRSQGGAHGEKKFMLAQANLTPIGNVRKLRATLLLSSTECQTAILSPSLLRHSPLTRIIDPAGVSFDADSLKM